MVCLGDYLLFGLWFTCCLVACCLRVWFVLVMICCLVGCGGCALRFAGMLALYGWFCVLVAGVWMCAFYSLLSDFSFDGVVVVFVWLLG